MNGNILKFFGIKKDLIENNIFDNATSANHINSIWDNPSDWWNSDKVLNEKNL